MKKQLPLLISFIVGAFAIAEFYIPIAEVGEIQETLYAFAQILAAAAFVLGGINVIQVNYPLIRRREPDWQFKVLLLVGALVMGLVGIKWHEFGGERSSGAVSYQAASQDPSQAVIRVLDAEDDTFVVIDGGNPVRAATSGAPFEILVEPGLHTVRILKRQSGYAIYENDVYPAAGEAAVITTDLVMRWGPSGRWYLWAYDHIFYPCNATMFALLAFFIASAAFRAFRARNTEAALLLGAAILVMLGRVPIGAAISDLLPQISDWIVDIPNNAGRRAIMMGAALGAIATGLRIILGLERSHLGAE